MGEALVYINRSSKNNAGGLKQRHIASKQVKAFENLENPERCLIKIYKLYAEKKTITNTAFYLKPQEKFGEERMKIEMDGEKNTVVIIFEL